MSDAEFRTYLEGGAREFTPPTQGRPGDLPPVVKYLAGDFGDSALYDRLQSALDGIEGKRGGPKNRIFYFATPPEADPAIVKFLGEKGLSRPDQGGRGSSWKSRSATTSSREND